MRAIRFQFQSHFAASANRLWKFHMQPEALELLSPRLMNFRILDPGAGVAEGSLVRARCGWWPFQFEWHALHSSVHEGRDFTDVALRSPFAFWVHRHHIEAAPEGGSMLTDLVWFLPPRWLPTGLARAPMRWMLRALFAWRHRQTRKALQCTHRPAPGAAGTTLAPCNDNGG